MSTRNANMEDNIVLWAKLCLIIVGLVESRGGVSGWEGRSYMYFWVSHVISIRKSWGGDQVLG